MATPVARRTTCSECPAVRLSRASIAAASACTAAGEPSESCSRASSSSASGLATATRPLPVRLASSSARSAAASSSSAPIGASHAETPIEQLPAGPCGVRGAPAAHALLDALGDGARRLLLGAREHEHELVAAVAGDLVVRAHLGAQRVGDAAQQRVAGGMAELVVDALEVVEVDQDAGERQPVARGAGDLLAHAHLHRAVVEQAGERVGARGGADVVVGLGVVAGDHGEVGDRLEHVQVVGG